MVELSFHGSQTKFAFAGDALNNAVYFRRSSPIDHEVDFVSVFGRDPLSEKMSEFIEAEGISTKCIAQHPDKLPGIYAISTSEDGERSFYFWRENSSARTLFEDGFSILNKFDVIYFSAITLAILPAKTRHGLLNWLDQSEVKVVFDSNYRPQLWADVKTARRAVSQAWQRTDIGLPSLDDEINLFGDRDEKEVLIRLQQFGLQDGALKRGALGPLSLSGRQNNRHIYALAAKVVDTTAAGDSFNGAYLAARFAGAAQADAMLAGHNLAREVIAHPGAIIQPPRLP